MSKRKTRHTHFDVHHLSDGRSVLESRDLDTDGILHAWERIDSNERLQRMYGRALDVPWLSNTLLYDDKIRSFFSAVNGIEIMLKEHKYFQVAQFVLLLLTIIRLVAYMTVHPRINFLAATMAEAGDDVMHFLVSFFILLLPSIIWELGSKAFKVEVVGES
jgi:hypothetical protein